MDFLELAKARYSCRSMDCTRPVPPAALEQVLEAARVAPTAANAQRQRIRVVQSEEGLAKMDECVHSRFNAPVVLVVSYAFHDDGRLPAEFVHRMHAIDIGIVSAHICLQAKELGLDTCICGLFKEPQLREYFDIPESEVICLVIPLGYAAADAVPSRLHEQRVPMEEICSNF